LTRLRPLPVNAFEDERCLFDGPVNVELLRNVGLGVRETCHQFNPLKVCRSQFHKKLSAKIECRGPDFGWDFGVSKFEIASVYQWSRRRESNPHGEWITGRFLSLKVGLSGRRIPEETRAAV
jgi:hypothetical protein